MTETKCRYEKPLMKVYLLPSRQQLLAGSGGLEDYNRPTGPYNW